MLLFGIWDSQVELLYMAKLQKSCVKKFSTVMDWNSIRKRNQERQKYAKIKRWMYKWSRWWSKWGSRHSNQFVFIDRFSITPTFSKTFTEDGRMGHLTRGWLQRSCKGSWRAVEGHSSPVWKSQTWSPDLKACHHSTFKKISPLRI